MVNKTWGGRFKKSLDPRVALFNASLSFDHILYTYDILGSQAHAAMLARQGLITNQEARSIHIALDEIRHEMEQGLHPLDETYEDIHMFIEHLLIQKTGDTGKKLHTGRSRNDQVALDLRLYTREKGNYLIDLVNELTEVLQQVATEHAQNKMPGYTHLQQAQPIYLGWFFDAYLAMFKRDVSRLHDWQKRMNFSPLGAGALAGSHLPLDRNWVAQTLGFDGIVENTIDAVSDRDFIIELCSTISIMMMHLSRLCEDLILWATQEFGFITLDDAFATGSSLMPNKKNPDVLELIRGKVGRVYGHLMGILTIMKGLPLAYNKDMQEDKEGLFDSVDTAIACLQIMTPFLQSLHFNTQNMQEKANSGYLDATAVLESLVLKGMPFRDAHHQVGLWVSEAMNTNCSLQTLCNPHELTIKPQALEQTTTLPHKPRHLLTGLELDNQEILQLLSLASQIKVQPKKYRSLLTNKNLAMIFEKPSLRTRMSFSLAIQELGGVVIESVNQTRKHEEPRDLIRVLNGYCDFVMVRTHEDVILQEMAAYAEIPLINGLSAGHHPCQVLADLLTLQEHFGSLSGLTLAYVGDGNNVLQSLLLMAPQLGVNINYCCPAQHQPNPMIVEQALKQSPAMIHSYVTPQAAVENAHAIYTDVWTSMGFEQHADESNFKGFRVNEKLMACARPEAVFMHCMPMVRGKEVSTTLPDAPCALLFTQSENRLHVQKALLLFLNSL